jgi:hypothetical protein
MLAYFSKYPQFVELSHLLLNYKKAITRNLQRTYGISLLKLTALSGVQNPFVLQVDEKS